MDSPEPASSLPGDHERLHVVISRRGTAERALRLALPGGLVLAVQVHHPVRRPQPLEAVRVARGATVFTVLNIYPYNSGHLMVLPYRHVADYTELEPAEMTELAEMTRTAIEVLRTVMAPHGFNLGINQGAVAGAGIAAHLHQHVVPRWGGDANFMPIVARTKTLPELLARTRERLAVAWPVPKG